MVRFEGASIGLLALLISVLPAHSAEIGPGSTPGCQVKYEGPVEAGDSDKLSAALDKANSESATPGGSISVCLNSLGGNYDEALQLITLVLKRTNIAMVIDKGAECYSACAFLFLAGNTQRSEDGELGPDRTLDVAATLGFHAPYLEADAPEATMANYRRGVSAIAKLLEIDRRELFPRGLLAKALQVGPSDLLYVDTVEKAGVWSIKLKGYKPPMALSARMIDQACRSKDIWTNFSHTVLGRPADDFEELHGIRQSDFPEIRGTDEPIKLVQGKYRTTLDLFGYEATNMCVVDVFSKDKDELFLSLSMIPTDQQGPPPEQFAEQIMGRLDDPQSLEIISTPLWYVFAPDTTLMSLARPGSDH
jgi:hypothetical protein